MWVSSAQGTASVGASEHISSTLLVHEPVLDIFLGNELSAFPSSWHFHSRDGVKFCLGRCQTSACVPASGEQSYCIGWAAQA